MSVLTDLIYGGSNAVAGLTEGAVNDAIAKYGADKEIAFPDTAYFFPTIYAATGVKVKTLGDLPACVGVLKSLITNQEDLGQALNAGLATAVGAEILEGLKYLEADPYANEAGIGFVPDPIIRSPGQGRQCRRCCQGCEGLPVQGHYDLHGWRLHRTVR